MLLKRDADTVKSSINSNGETVESYFKDDFIFMKAVHSIQRHEYFYGDDPFRIHSIAIADSGIVTFVNVVLKDRIIDGYELGKLIPRYFLFTYEELVNIQNAFTSSELALIDLNF